MNAVRKACGKPNRYSEAVMYLDYPDGRGNTVEFMFGPTGVTITYADRKRVMNPDLIASLNNMSCLSKVDDNLDH
jgi:hypothetical protein